VRVARLVAPVLLACGMSACGGGSSTTPTPPPQTNPYTITITSGGVASPNDLTVPQGARVLFVNNDSRRHDMTSDDHPDHFECPPLNQVGVLTPGQSRESGNLNTARTCGFHDHDNPSDRNLQGSIIIR
jgi:plastocyanin